MSAVTTSNLSVDELYLMEEAGFDTLDFVMGSSYTHIGLSLAGWSTNTELTAMSQAMHQARMHAMTRLVGRAVKVGADGVVGVRLMVEHSGHHAEFLAMGTAVRARRERWGERFSPRRGPFTSDLDGQDFWALLRAGYRPHQLVMGVCVYHVAHQGLGAWLGSMGQNQEMTDYTRALYEAREIAMGRMRHEAENTGATGVVGVTAEEGSYGWHSHVIEFLAVGTSIGPTGDAWDHEGTVPIVRTS